MADINTRGTRSGGGGTLILALLLLVVVALVAWLLMRGGGDDSSVEVNVPNVEAPSTPNVEVKGDGDNK
jgi:Tfp pilus assembly protein PilX